MTNKWYKKIILICYDELSKHDIRIPYTPKYGINIPFLSLWEGVPTYKTKTCVLEECVCEICGQEFLQAYGSKIKLCSKECSTELSIWNAEWLSRKLKAQNRPKIVVSQKYLLDKKTSHQVKAKRYFELQELGKTRPLYDRYLNLVPYYPIIRNPKEPDVLLAKCAYCDCYYEPKLSTLKQIRSFVNGENSKKLSSTLFCSINHAKKFYSEMNKFKKVWQEKFKPKKDNTILIIKWYANLRKRQNRIAQIILKNKRVKEREIKRHITAEELRLRSLLRNKRPTDPEELRQYNTSKALARINNLKANAPKTFKLSKLLYYSRVRAKEKGLINELTIEWLEDKVKTGLCELTKLPFDYNPAIQRNPFGPSIDRINIKEGYTPENCRIVLWVVNAGLGHYTEKDLYTICKAYLNFNNIK